MAAIRVCDQPANGLSQRPCLRTKTSAQSDERSGNRNVPWVGQPVKRGALACRSDVLGAGVATGYT